MTSAGGVRLQPTREALRAFVGGLGKLGAGAVAAALERRLQSNLWQTRFKALCVLEAVLRQEGDTQCDAIFDFFADKPEALHGNVDSPQASVRDKTKRVLDLLGLRHQGATSQHQESAPAVTVPDLIDVGGEEEQRGDGTPAASPSVASGVADLLGSGGGADVTPVSSGPNIDVTPVSSGAATVADLLGGADDFLGSSPHPPVASAPAPYPAPVLEPADPFAALSATADVASASELFEGLSINSTGDASGPAGAVSSGGDLFAGMSLDSQQPQQQQLRPSPSGGAAAAAASAAAAAAAAGVASAHRGGGPPMLAGGAAGGASRTAGSLASPALMQQQQQWAYMQAAAAGPMGMGRGMPMPMMVPAGMPGAMPVPMMMVPPGGMMMGPGGVPMPMGVGMGGMGMGMGVGGVGMGMPGGMMGPGGMAAGASGAGRPGDDFDFSGNPTPRPPIPAPKEDTHAFDFVSDHIAAMGSKKAPSAAAMRSS